MKRLLVAALVLAIAVPAFAGNNPCVRMYIDFDPPNYTHAVDPAIYTSVPAYVMADCLDHQGFDGGFTTVSFALAVTPGMTSPPAFASLLPGGLAIGSWDTGITLASTECMNIEPVQIGRLDLFYLGSPGCVELVDHPDYPRWVVDCQEPGVVDYYCLLAHGSVGGGTCPEPEDCPCPCGSAVEDMSWSGIKALYQ